VLTDSSFSPGEYQGISTWAGGELYYIKVSRGARFRADFEKYGVTLQIKKRSENKEALPEPAALAGVLLWFSLN